MSRGMIARSSRGTVGRDRKPPELFALFVRLLPLVLLPLFASCSMGITARRYALVYGAGDYVGTDNDLQTPDDDAQDMAAALNAAGWTVAVTREPTVTRAQILADIMNLTDVVDSDSSVLVFFSGHGTIDSDGAAYIVPTDGNVLSSSSLLSAVNALPCRNRILVLDTCYSGGFVTATDTGTVDSAPQNYGKLDDGTASWAFFAALANYSALLSAAFDSYNAYTPIVVTAAGAEELSWDTHVGTEGNGVFTKYFLLAATNGDSNGDGYVTIQEAYAYAREKVEKYWNAHMYDYPTGYGAYADFLPRISGNARDVVIF